MEFRWVDSLREIFFKTDRIHSFDVGCWKFDVGRSLVSFPIRLNAGGQKAALRPEPSTLNREPLNP
jgi:hypothetical protein